MTVKVRGASGTGEKSTVDGERVERSGGGVQEDGKLGLHLCTEHPRKPAAEQQPAADEGEEEEEEGKDGRGVEKKSKDVSKTDCR